MAEERYDLRNEMIEVLLHKVSEDRYPSVTMLDMIERLVPPEQQDEYVRVLMEKVRDDTYPSMDLLRRLSRFT